LQLVAGHCFVFAPAGRGELRLHLLSHGIGPVVSRDSGLLFDRLEVAATVNADAIQAALGGWNGDHP